MLAVRDVMTAEVQTVPPETPLKDAAARLADLRVGALPVVDECDRPLGVVTRSDVLENWKSGRAGRALRLRRSNRRAGPAIVEQAMTAPAITVESTAELSFALDRMHDHDVNHLPVVEHGAVIGIITRHDLVCASLRDDEELAEEIRHGILFTLNWPDAVKVQIEEGHVTVSGQVDTLRDARLLPVMIRKIFGVTGVDAELAAWDHHHDGPVVVSSHL